MDVLYSQLSAALSTLDSVELEVRASLLGARVALNDMASRLLEREAAIGDERTQLDTQRAQLDVEKEQFAKEKASVAELSARGTDLVVLNVGGEVFSTTRATLCSVPDSMLAAMFSGRHRCATNEEGHYVIDRDPKCFRYVLDYLRHGGRNIPLPTGWEDLMRVQAEFDYFCLPAAFRTMAQALGESPVDVRPVTLPYPVWCVTMYEGTVVTGSLDCKVRVFDLVTRSCLHVLHGHTNYVSCAAVRGKIIASGGEDHTVRLWERVGGQQRHVLRGHDGGIIGLALNDHSTLCASMGSDKLLRTWDVETGKCLQVFDVGRLVRGIAFFGGGTIAAPTKKGVRFWDAKTGKQQMSLAVECEHTHAVMAVQVVGRLCVAQDTINQFTLWDPLTGCCLRKIDCLALASVSCFVATADSLFVCADNSNEIVVVDMVRDCVVGRLQGHTHGVSGLAVDVPSKTLISASHDSTFRIWTPREAEQGTARPAPINSAVGLA